MLSSPQGRWAVPDRLFLWCVWWVGTDGVAGVHVCWCTVSTWPSEKSSLWLLPLPANHFCYFISEDFLANVRDEVRHQARRLGHHASITLWSGNNENQVKPSLPYLACSSVWLLIMLCRMVLWMTVYVLWTTACCMIRQWGQHCGKRWEDITQF